MTATGGVKYTAEFGMVVNIGGAMPISIVLNEVIPQREKAINFMSCLEKLIRFSFS